MERRRRCGGSPAGRAGRAAAHDAHSPDSTTSTGDRDGEAATAGSSDGEGASPANPPRRTTSPARAVRARKRAMPQKLANASKAADGALGKVTDGASKARREAQDKPARGGGFRLRVASLLTVLFAAFAAVVLVLQMPSALVLLLGRDAAGGAGAQRARCRAYVDADALRRCSPHERWADWTDDLAFAVRQGAAGRAADSTQFAARKAAALLLTVRGGPGRGGGCAALHFPTDCGAASCH